MHGHTRRDEGSVCKAHKLMNTQKEKSKRCTGDRQGRGGKEEEDGGGSGGQTLAPRQR